QMHMLVDVVRRQDHLPVGGARGAPHAQCSVITNVLHGEQITVGHPPYRAPGVVEKDLIPASNDGVSGGDLIAPADGELRSEEHTSELQSRFDLVCCLLLEQKKNSSLIRLNRKKSRISYKDK